MYFLNVQKVAEQFRFNTIDNIDKVVYFLFSLVQLLLRFTVFNALPFLYHTLFYSAQYQLDEAIQLPHLKLAVYHTVDHIIPFFLLLFCSVMFFLFYVFYGRYAGRYTPADFVERVVCLSFPISMRIIMMTSFVFLVATFSIGFYFNSELLMLGQKIDIKNGWLQILYHLLDKINVIGWISEGIKTLKQAEALFVEMNWWSWYFYCVSQVFALFSTFWYFCVLKRYLAKSYS